MTGNEQVGEDHLGDHPEDLLDQVRASGMAIHKWPGLQEHLATCSSCAIQFHAAPVTEEASTAESKDIQLDHLVTENVLWRLRREQRARLMRPSLFSPLRLRFAVVLLLCSGSAASATWWSAHYLVERTRGPVVAPAVTTVQEQSLRAANGPAQRPLPPAADSPAAHPEQEGGPAAATDGSRWPDRRTSHGAIPALARSGAGELFDRARTLRLAGDIRAASSVLRRLQREYPRTVESDMSHLILGRLLLGEGRLEQAASQFGRYLEAGGDAAEEALAGRANAFARLGRRVEETNDWRALLSAYPRSVYGDRARTRLAALLPPANSPPTLPVNGR